MVTFNNMNMEKGMDGTTGIIDYGLMHMEKLLRGKYLVRKTKLNNGTYGVTITGMYVPLNFNIEDINDNDEMWVSDLIVKEGGLKFTHPEGDVGSPDDFLAGRQTKPEQWASKTSL